MIFSCKDWLRYSRERASERYVHPLHTPLINVALSTVGDSRALEGIVGGILAEVVVRGVARVLEVAAAVDVAAGHRGVDIAPVAIGDGVRNRGVLRIVVACVYSNFFSSFWLFWQTLRGPFSAVSKPTFASQYSFESSRRDLQDCYTFTPVRIKKCS